MTFYVVDPISMVILVFPSPIIGNNHWSGVYRYVNGAVYEGEFNNGMKEGKGVLECGDGEVFEG